MWEIAERNTPHERVADYTQAIMDLGATLCTRSNPACDRCPVAADCEALSLGSVTELPGRKPKKEKPLRATTMVLACHDGQVYLERRPESGIWGGLWCFPELEDPAGAEGWCLDRFGRPPQTVARWPAFRHTFSHYHLEIRPVQANLDATPTGIMEDTDQLWYNRRLPPAIGLAAPVAALLAQLA